MNHIFLEEKNKGTYATLRGNIFFCYFLIRTPGSPWAPASQIEITKAAKKAADFFESEASKKGVNLKIKNVINHGSLSHSVRVSDDSASREKELLSAVNYSDINNMRSAFKAKYHADNVVFVFVFQSNGRAFASGGKYAIIFKGDTEGTIIHEVCHLFGAQDLYFPDCIREKANQHFKQSIMLHSKDLAIDPLTSYLIGWDDSPDRTAAAFLRDTAHVTNEQLEKARKEGTKSGYGELTNEHGTYKGNLKDGFYEGYGIFYYYGGDRYEGEWENNSRNGKGTYFYANGDRYEGKWKNDEKHGRGTYYYNNGSRYKGRWKNGEKHGYGTSYFDDGSRYKGRWKNGEKHGFGTYRYANGARYIGKWKNGEKHGFGTYYYANGARYKGRWKNGLQNGLGTYRYSDGTRYKGKWKDGKQNGRGTFYHSNGSRSKGIWINGRLK